MSKLFACIFPYSRASTKPSTSSSSSSSDDIKNTAFHLSSSEKNASVCELSYHHVDAVTTKQLQKRIQKLEAEKEALVEMMIYQHEDFKRRHSVASYKIDVPKTKKTQKAVSGNYYTIANFERTIRSQPQENIDDESHMYMSID